MIIRLAPQSSHIASQRLPGLAAETLADVRAVGLVFIEGP
jgi:hypothetical protein